MSDFLGKPPVIGDFGIEIECEGEGLKFVDTASWDTKADGSLRGEYPDECAEYVSKKVFSKQNGCDEVFSVVDAKKHPKISYLLDRALGGSVITPSARTSVHVHVNILHLTRAAFCNYVFILMLLEKSLIKISGKGRQGNRFCLSLRETPGTAEAYSEVFSNKDTFPKLELDHYKYAAINLSSVQRYGTIEIRCLEGTRDVKRITEWVGILVALRELARGYKNPLHVWEDFLNIKESRLYDVICKFKSLQTIDIENDVLYSCSFLCEIPLCYVEIKENL